MVAESWFRSFWKIPRRHEGGSERVEIGVLAFEVASLMSKLVHLWRCLSDKQVSRLREEIMTCVGIKKLVSEDEGYIGHLICAEMIETVTHVAKSVARLAKKCSDPGLKSFELAFTELVQIGADPYCWIFSLKKMDKKVKKMERLLDAPPETLAASALALHYANVIIVIEKLAASPHLIGNDARDDLYNMLPTSVRAALRARLKPYAKSLTSSVFDTELAEDWTEAMAAILEWLAPLAHNMIRWQSERSFEQQSFVSGTNALLVQTLYFANREKTEAAIIEILVGLNYVWRLGRELNAKALQECASSRNFDECLYL
ncbi:hypothetical protein GOBAR_DD26816 [Gossypium barbadense]|nr:hypothetical protein GOBAR_DD26816 [Gossypium barbadense]